MLESERRSTIRLGERTLSVWGFCEKYWSIRPEFMLTVSINWVNYCVTEACRWRRVVLARRQISWKALNVGVLFFCEKLSSVRLVGRYGSWCAPLTWAA